MKKNFLSAVMFLAAIVWITTSCEDNDDSGDNGNEEEFELPTITLLSPDIPEAGLEPAIGTSLSFELAVHADAGLSQVLVSGDEIAKYTGEALDDTLSYDLLIEDNSELLLEFEVRDATGQSASVDAISVVPTEGEDLGLVVLDFAGASTGSEPGLQDEWDTRTIYTFDVTGGVTDQAKIQVVNSEATLTFQADNPDGDGKVFKTVKMPPEDFDGNSWEPTGGWAHHLIDLQETIPQDVAEAIKNGTKVIKVDVYYDATVTENYVMDSILTLEDRYDYDLWNADPSNGYKVDMILANTEKHLANHDEEGFFYAQIAYFTEENQWVTLEFNTIDEGRESNFEGEGAVNPATSDEVDMIHMIPSPDYEAATGGIYNENPLYMKNLRIVDVE